MQKKPGSVRFSVLQCRNRVNRTEPDRFKKKVPRLGQYKQKKLCHIPLFSPVYSPLTLNSFSFNFQTISPLSLTTQSHPPSRPLALSAKAVPVPEHPQPIPSRLSASPSPLSSLLRLRKHKHRSTINVSSVSTRPKQSVFPSDRCFLCLSKPVSFNFFSPF